MTQGLLDKLGKHEQLKLACATSEPPQANRRQNLDANTLVKFTSM